MDLNVNNQSSDKVDGNRDSYCCTSILSDSFFDGMDGCSKAISASNIHSPYHYFCTVVSQAY